MLFPRHPQPVRRAREVAELTVRQAPREAVAPRPVIDVSPKAPAIARPVARAAATACASEVVAFEVRYRVAECLDVVGEFARRELSRRREARGQAPIATLPWPTRALVAACAAPVFAFKKWRMPWCRFRIDDDGIARRTRRGTLRASWRDVVSVDRYGQGDLVRLARGAMPLPRRCLDDARRAAFERLVERHAGAADVTAARASAADES